MALSGFICHDDYLKKTERLTDEEVGRLFRALMAYHATGEEKDMPGREWLAFDFIKQDIDRAEAAHAEKCAKNRANRLTAIENDRQRSSTIDDDRQRSLSYKEKDKDKEKEKDKDKEPKKRFIPPTVEEVAAYMKEIGCAVDPQYFVDYHIARNWVLSNGKQMRDWKATVRTWAHNNFSRRPQAAAKTVSAQNYTQRDYSDEQADAIRRMLASDPERGAV